MLKEIYKRVIIVSIALGMLTFGVRYFFEFSLLDALIGVACGMLLCIIRFKMLANNINQVVEMDKDVAQKMGMTGYVGRYMLTALCLIVAILYKVDTFFAMVITLVIATHISARTVKLEDEKKEVNVDER